MAFEPNYEKVVSSYRRKLGVTQTMVDCKLPTDEGITKLLCTSAKSHINSSEIEGNTINYLGCVSFQVIYTNQNNEVVGTDYTVEFKEKFTYGEELNGVSATTCDVIDVNSVVNNGELKIVPPKTKAAERTIILPPQLVEILKQYKTRVKSQWLFPSPNKTEDVPRDPSACRKRLAKILENAGCKHVPFHALRHTFATQALRYGMDVKTLASTIGHESVETTLNVYSHTTDEGMRNAAKAIDKAIGVNARRKNENNDTENEVEQIPEERQKKPPKEKFEPHKGKYRRPGTGSIHQVSKNTWEGRYSPIVNGKRIARNIYANSIEECEQKLAELIKEMKEEFNIR